MSLALAIAASVLMGALVIWDLRRQTRRVRGDVRHLGQRVGELDEKVGRGVTTSAATLAEVRALNAAAARLGPGKPRSPMGSSPGAEGGE